MIRLLILASLASCVDTAPLQPDALSACGSADTETGGELNSCTTNGGHDGMCTQDLHGTIQCFPTCTAQSECDAGSSSYVLQLQNGDRVCFCAPDQAGP